MKKTQTLSSNVCTGRDLLTCLANHGKGELLEYVASFLVEGRTVKTYMIIGEESGWKKNMHIAIHGIMTDKNSNTIQEFPLVYTSQSSKGSLLWMCMHKVQFEGIMSGGMLHITKPPQDLEVVQLTDQNKISINTFPEVPTRQTDNERHIQTYKNLIRRRTVFIRKTDGSIGLTIGHKSLRNMEDASTDENTHDVASASDVHDMFRKMIMPVEDASILTNASCNPFITFEVISKYITIKTKVSTLGKIPIAFRLNNMQMEAHALCEPVNQWAFLVPQIWVEGHTTTTSIDGINSHTTFNKSFNEVASAVVDKLIISNSAHVPSIMPVCNRKDASCCSIFDLSKVRRTPEGRRLKVAALRKINSMRKVFCMMCVY
jgi:hypothetical protein